MKKLTVCFIIDKVVCSVFSKKRMVLNPNPSRIIVLTSVAICRFLSCISPKSFAVANPQQGMFSLQIAAFHVKTDWTHLMRLLGFNSAPMLRNASGEPELLGRFDARVPSTTLVSSGQSTARHFFFANCGIPGGGRHEAS